MIIGSLLALSMALPAAYALASVPVAPNAPTVTTTDGMNFMLKWQPVPFATVYGISMSYVATSNGLTTALTSVSQYCKVASFTPITSAPSSSTPAITATCTNIPRHDGYVSQFSIVATNSEGLSMPSPGAKAPLAPAPVSQPVKPVTPSPTTSVTPPKTTVPSPTAQQIRAGQINSLNAQIAELTKKIAGKAAEINAENVRYNNAFIKCPSGGFAGGPTACQNGVNATHKNNVTEIEIKYTGYVNALNSLKLQLSKLMTTSSLPVDSNFAAVIMDTLMKPLHWLFGK